MQILLLTALQDSCNLTKTKQSKTRSVGGSSSLKESRLRSFYISGAEMSNGHVSVHICVLQQSVVVGPRLGPAVECLTDKQSTVFYG